MKIFKIIKECIVDLLLVFEKNYRFFIGLVIIGMLIWLSYDLGGVLSQRNMEEELGGKATQQLNTKDMISQIKNYDSKKGILYINFDGVKFKNDKGIIYSVNDFNEQVNKNDLDIIQEKLNVKGRANINIIPQNKAEKTLLSTLILEFITKLLWLSFYIFIIYYLSKMLFKNKYGVHGKKFVVYDKNSTMKIKIKDVAGQGEAKKEVIEIVDYLKNSEKYDKVGAKMPKGVLLYGPPGTGKTILAKAIAGESEASFISQSASSFVDTYVGQGAASIRMLFKEARTMKPCVIFIDEIDAIATKRSMGGSEERLQALNQLLTEMDGFEDNKGIVVVAATNRVEVIDEAIVRPGRFDRKVLINLPSESERVEILNIYVDNTKILPDVDISKIAKRTISFSGADLENLVNEAAIEAARSSNDKISMSNFESARDRILMGVKNSRKPTEEEYKVLAYHELGHAIISYNVGRKVEKISIIPRGLSLGVTINEFKDDILRSEQDLKNDVIILMAGRAAEEIFCNQITTGSHDDINKASNIARQMVSIFGFNKDTPYIPESESLKIQDENHAKEILKESYNIAKEKLKKDEESMKILFDILMENKEISGSIIENILYPKKK